MVATPTWTIVVMVAATMVIPAFLPEQTFRKWFETPWQTQRRLDLKWKIRRQRWVKRFPGLDSKLPEERPDRQWPTL